MIGRSPPGRPIASAIARPDFRAARAAEQEAFAAVVGDAAEVDHRQPNAAEDAVGGSGQAPSPRSLAMAAGYSESLLNGGDQLLAPAGHLPPGLPPDSRVRGGLGRIGARGSRAKMPVTGRRPFALIARQHRIN
jgi:hypothetical protein